MKLAVLASRSGTNFMSDTLTRPARGALDADIRLVICNRPGAKVIERAKAAGIIHAVMIWLAEPREAMIWRWRTPS